MAPIYVKGREIRRTAAAASRRWQRLHFADLAAAATSERAAAGVLRLPITSPSAGVPPRAGGPTNAPSLCLRVTANSAPVMSFLTESFAPFWTPSPLRGAAGAAPRAADGSECAGAIVSQQVRLCAGAPARLGCPKSLEVEAANWAEAVYRGEAYAYNRAVASQDGSERADAISPVGAPARWLSQQLLDGFVSCRVNAHAGVTTQAMLHARRVAGSFGRHLPPFDQSPYYAASELLDQWCLFGAPEKILSTGGTDAASAGQHIVRVLELALGSTLLPGFNGYWLNGAVVASRETGEAVLVLGPAGSGKTTTALHSLAACPGLDLVAANRFFLCDGRQVPAPSGALPSPGGPSSGTLLVGLPGPVFVGLGSVLGTMLPNPFLAAHLSQPPEFLRDRDSVAQLLRNSDTALWRMSMKFPVQLSAPSSEGDGTSAGSTRMLPALLGNVRGIVLLKWNVAELDAAHTGRAATTVEQLSLVEHRAQVAGLLDSWGVARDHYLLRSVYDARDASTQALELLCRRPDGAMPSVSLLEGAVDFSVALAAIRDMLE